MLIQGMAQVCDEYEEDYPCEGPDCPDYVAVVKTLGLAGL